MKIKHVIFAFTFLCAGALHAEDQSWLNSLWQQLTELASNVVEKTKQIFTGSSVPATVQEKMSDVQATVQDKLDQVGQQVVSAVKEIKEDVQAELSKIGTPEAQAQEENKIVIAEQPLEKVSASQKTAAIVEKSAPKISETVTVTEGIEDIINKPTTKHPTDESKSPAVFTQADKQDLENQLNTQLPAQIKKPSVVEEEIMLIEPLSAGQTKPEPQLIIETVGAQTISVPVTTLKEENRALMKELESLSEVEKANVIE